MASITTEESQPSHDANHPPLSYNFPKRPFGKKNVVYRSCHAEWFRSWSWLHYEEEKDAVVCHVCTTAMKEGKIKSGSAEPAFVSCSADKLSKSI